MRATGVVLSREKTLAADVSEYTWQAGQVPVKMIPVDEGICILSMLEGTWSKPGDVARVYIDEGDGHWYLSGGEADSKASARAMAIRFFGRPR